MSENYSAKRVPLEAVISGIEMASDTFTYYLDLETMEQVSVADELMTGIDDTETAELIDENPGRFLRLPTQWDIHEYRIMEEFVYSLEDGDAKQSLARAIQGRGAFRRFKDALVQYGVRQRGLIIRPQHTESLQSVGAGILIFCIRRTALPPSRSRF